MATETEQDVFLLPEEVSKIIGFSVDTLAGWRSAGENEGPPWKRVGGRSVRYLKSAVDAWMKSQPDGI